MKYALLEIKNVRGFHATPACMFAQTAMQFESKIKVGHYDSERMVNAKALVLVVSLGGKTGDVLRVEATGADEEAAIAALTDLVERRNFDGE